MNRSSAGCRLLAAVLFAGSGVPMSVCHAAAPAPEPRIEVGEQPSLPEDGCIYAGLGYSDRVFINIKPGIFQCRAQHWYLSVDASPGAGISPSDFASGRAQPTIAGDGCIYAGLGFSDGAVIQTTAGNFLCKSHHWDHG